jgi:hypothetical protein
MLQLLIFYETATCFDFYKKKRLNCFVLKSGIHVTHLYVLITQKSTSYVQPTQLKLL